MSSRALTEALAALIEERGKAERVVADRRARVSHDAGGEALSALFSGVASPAPVSAAQAPENGSQSASAEPYDWTEIDARVAAMKAAEATSPSTSPETPPASSEPATDAALFAMLNNPQENA